MNCYKCDINCDTPKGIIYVRDKNPITNKFDNMPICEPCWIKYFRS